MESRYLSRKSGGRRALQMLQIESLELGDSGDEERRRVVRRFRVLWEDDGGGLEVIGLHEAAEVVATKVSGELDGEEEGIEIGLRARAVNLEAMSLDMCLSTTEMLIPPKVSSQVSTCNPYREIAYDPTFTQPVILLGWIHKGCRYLLFLRLSLNVVGGFGV